MANNSQPIPSQWHVFKRLFGYMFRYKWLTLFALLFLFVVSIIETTIPLVARYYIDEFVMNAQPFHATSTILIGYYVLFLLQSFSSYTGNLLFARVSYSVVRDIRYDAFVNVQRLGMRYFDRTPVGSLVSRMTNDTEAIAGMFNGILNTFIRAIFVFTVTLYTMLTLDIYLTGIIWLLLPLIFVFVYLYRLKSTPIIQATRSKLSDLNVKLSESIDGMRIIQAFRQEQRLMDEFEAINGEHLMYSNRAVNVDSLLLRPALSLLKLLAYALLMTYFGLSWQKIGLTAGLMHAYIQYVNRLFDPLIQVMQNFSTLQTSMVSAGRVFALIDEQEHEPIQRATHHEMVEGEIAFQNVTFSYDGVRNVLEDISFTVKRGETIAFVGHTGSGKSSIINLFMRFYEFEKGHIYIDGVDIKEYAPETLRHNIGLVLQEPFLYHGTIASNIRMHQAISDEAVQLAAQFVDADTFIRQLPYQYDEPVTERGSTLSTGQRQLVAFARTVAANPKILILDEATANIDSETEETIQRSLSKMREGRTTIAIAHRLSTIQDANCIYVLDKGRIIESGTHDELLALRGTYYKMYQLQAGSTK